MKKLLVLALCSTCSFCNLSDYVLKTGIEQSWIVHVSAIHEYKEECKRFPQMNEAYKDNIDNLDTLLDLTYNSMHESYDENKLRKAKSNIEQHAKTFEKYRFLKHI